jgi:hypothetical protein
LHIVEAGHSFVDCMPYQSGSSAQRIRIGLTGLAFAFLLVLLGSVVLRSSRDNNVNDSVNAAHNAATNEPTEPLAELGVAPGSSESTNNSSTKR